MSKQNQKTQRLVVPPFHKKACTVSAFSVRYFVRNKYICHIFLKNYCMKTTTWCLACRHRYWSRIVLTYFTVVLHLHVVFFVTFMVKLDTFRHTLTGTPVDIHLIFSIQPHIGLDPHNINDLRPLQHVPFVYQLDIFLTLFLNKGFYFF